MIRYRSDIDGLRAVAVIPVVLFHAGLPSIGGGYVGVDVFFVISGYLITAILWREIGQGTFSLVKFYERRFRRILPALFAVLAATVVGGWLIQIPSDLRGSGSSLVATSLFASNLLFYRTLGYFSSEAEYAPLLHTWSLAIEEQFYIVFPLVLMLCAAVGWRHRIFAIVLFGSLVSLALSIWAVSDNPKAGFYLIPFRAWELGAGALLALAADRIPPVSGRRADLAGLAGLAAILASIFLYDAGTPFPGAAALPPVLGSVAIIYAGMSGEGVVARILSNRILVGIGLISYSLYLWHWPILSLMRAWQGSLILPVEMTAVAVAASVGLAVLSYYLVEQPFRKKPPAGPTKRQVFGFSATGMAAFVAIGAAFYVGKGMPERFPPETRMLAPGLADTDASYNRCGISGDLEPECVIGSGTGGDILLWGDSHAAAMVAAVRNVGQRMGLSAAVATSSTCPPLLDISLSVPTARECRDHNERVVRMLQSGDRWPVVVLVARWPLYVEGNFYGEERDPPIQLNWTGSKQSEDLSNDAVVSASLLRTIDMIEGTGRKVILLDAPPEIGRNIPRMLAAHSIKGEPLPLGPLRLSVERRRARTDAIFADVRQQREAMTYITLTERMCDRYCAIIVGGVPAYRDDDHLSDRGAIRFVAPLLEQAVAAGSSAPR